MSVQKDFNHSLDLNENFYNDVKYSDIYSGAVSKFHKIPPSCM